MDAVTKVLKKIKQQVRPPEKLEPTWKKLRAQAAAKRLREESWERDKEIVRDQNFKKAQAARQIQLDAIHAEQERQAQIALDRLENLKKARRKLKRIRNEQNAI